jgi:hypothetical protein
MKNFLRPIRTYISYIDSQRNARKPFLIPQKNPTFYKNFLRVMNVPEFITRPVQISGRKLCAAARGPAVP